LAKKRRVPRPAKRKGGEEDYYFQSLVDQLKRSLGTKVEIRRKGKQGRIVVYFYSDDELDRLLDLMG
jgi:ParB family chromosome partitioning protein